MTAYASPDWAGRGVQISVLREAWSGKRAVAEVAMRSGYSWSYISKVHSGRLRLSARALDLFVSTGCLSAAHAAELRTVVRPGGTLPRKLLAQAVSPADQVRQMIRSAEVVRGWPIAEPAAGPTVLDGLRAAPPAPAVDLDGLRAALELLTEQMLVAVEAMASALGLSCR